MENPTFYLLVRGSGEGCDYTLSCNETWIETSAKTWEEAEKEAIEFIKDHGYEDVEEWENRDFKEVGKYGVVVDSIEILQVTRAEEFDIEGWLEPLRKKAKERSKKKRIAKDQADLKRLQTELGRLQKKLGTT